MSRINRDTYVAIFLLVLCGVFFVESLSIREIDYGILKPSAWPQAILVVLSVLSLIYLVRSLRQPPPAETAEAPVTLRGVLEKYRNPLWCYGLFLAFLLTLDYLGMLIGGVLFVFSLLTAIGGAGARRMLVHAVIALATIGVMWAIFTYALGVILPQGEIFTTL